MLPSLLVITSAAIVFALGLLHLIFTFHGQKLHPRDRDLEESLKAVSPVISGQTTMWKAWIGFNASHSFGAMFFGLVYGYLALAHPQVLFRSAFLLILGLVLLGGYVFLARRYWFSVPFRGILLATALYVAALTAVLVG